ncbi:DUF1707 domain-containing protein [Streptomyces sparsogenes]|uniref:DUF1707 SHOCT-like domain-containing protein n=1 Tax=Streptomyces sparsogenes TaxID=67365 RepID=UPI0033DDB029
MAPRPQAGSQMRASDAERERIAEALREGVAEGRLTMEEFEERLDAAYRARTHAELEPLVQDLPVPGRPAAAGPAPAAEGGWAGRIGSTPTSRTGIAVMSGFQRKGRWTVPRRFTSFVFWGGGEIDLREARFEDRDTVIRCFAIMGGIQVTAPPDLDVHVGGVGILGAFDNSGSGEGSPDSPRVTVTGLALFGGVAVERKLRKEESRRLKEDRKRFLAERHEERRELRAERHAERRELRAERRERRRSLDRRWSDD